MAMDDLAPLPVVTQEIRIVDAEGLPRIVLSAHDGVPAIKLLGVDGKPGATVSVDPSGRPSLKLANPNPNPDWPTVALEIDDKGAHLKIERPGGASSYLFLNNSGGSGIVLIDAGGVRRFSATVAPDGTTKVEPPR
jgi:hypothetical protein